MKKTAAQMDAVELNAALTLAQAKSGLSDEAFVDHIIATRQNAFGKAVTGEYIAFYVILDEERHVAVHKWVCEGWDCILSA